MLDWNEEVLQIFLHREDSKAALAYFEEGIYSIYTHLSDIKIRYALYLQGLPFDDYPNAIKIIDSILQIELNSKAVLLKAYIEDTHQGQISVSTLGLIDKFIQPNNELDNEIISQFYYIKALYFRYINSDQYHFYLTKANELNTNMSQTYYLLYQYYKEIGENLKSQEFLKISISKIKHIYVESEYIDPTNWEEFIRENITGIHITKVNYDSMIEAKVK